MSKSRNVMVCVTQQKTCERLIMNGHHTLKGDNDNLFVIHVVNENDSFLNNGNDGEALEYLFGVSKKVGADLTVLRSKDITKAIEDFSKKHNITHMIMGSSPNGKGIENHNFALNLQKKLPAVKFIIV
ncbi:universal stress protein UspA [Sporosalibacterium faouarense]|uniref:universal stress protein UspA n=1 Tax=Sporosalibacterium faouarense TaxID=516123 RepID=UPI00141D06CF|nr:universal stress protein UspA [Sporosalibacterium faouarense]MTI48464.1 universal stress protein UspA [Bacillota bacterium]